MTDRQAFTATVGQARHEARGGRRRPARKGLAAMVARAGPILAAVLLLAVGLSDRAAQAQMTDETAVLTIAAGSDTYGYEIDNVVFTVTRTGMIDSEISGSVTMTQDDTYLPSEELQWTFTIPANETTVTHTILWARFSGGAMQTGDLTATLDDGDDYEVGTPGAATVEMVVLDPAITVRPDKAAYSFDEDDAAASVTFVARTAPGLPRPNAKFRIGVVPAEREDGADFPDDFTNRSKMIDFEPGDFVASGSEWEASKEYALSIVDDGENEGDETFDLQLHRGNGVPSRIGLRQADGSVCPEEGCLTPVTLSDPPEDPVLTIAAGSDSYGYQIDNVVFTVTRTGTTEEAIGGSVTMTQDDTYLPAASLSWTFSIPASETSVSHTLSRSAFSGGATQTGDLTATLDEGDDYDVGTPGAATVEMVVANPAITVRPEKAAYSFDEDDAAASVTFVARTAPNLPQPSTGFSVSVTAKARSDGAGSPDDYAAVSELIAFASDDFTASGSEWEASKEIALTIVDDGVAEGDETFDLLLEGVPGLPNRIKLRQADGTVCSDEGCLTPVTLSDPREVPVLTIAAERASYGYGIDDIGFVVNAAGPRDGAIEAAVTLTQDDSYLQQAALSQTVLIEPDKTSARLVLTLQSQTFAASQTGTLTATLDAADGYEVGSPGSATVSMVVLDPAITVRPERVAYRFVEGQADTKLAYVARTEPGLPKPNRGFDVLVVTSPYPGGASIPADLAFIQREVEFQPGDFILQGSGHWVARKEVALAIVDDEEPEPEESLNMLLLTSSSTLPTVQIRQTDGSECSGNMCLTSVAILDDDGPAVTRIAITPVPPAASADHGPYYIKDEFLALPDDAVHGRGATLTFTLTLDTEVTVTGSPQLVLDVFDRERRARYTGGSGTAQLAFVWTVAKGDNDPDGLEVTSLDLKGGTIRDAQGHDLLQDTVALQRFAEHRVRGGLHAMRLEVSGSAREGEPFEIRVIRNGGYDEVAVAGVGVADSFLPLVKPSYHYAVNGPGRRQFDFNHGEPSEPGVRVSTRTMTPPGDGVADDGRTLTIRLTGTDAGFQLTPPLGSYRAWYLAEGPLEVTVPVIDTGQPLAEAGLRVHGASVREAPGAKLVFRVTLSPHSESPVTVDYRTGDDPHNKPKAVPGSDYVATSDSLTFAPGETQKTVEVEVLADDHDEQYETMRLFLENAQGARLDTDSALGVIKNDGPIPRAWIGRFGRAVAEQVLDAVESRMRAARQPGVQVTLAGQRVGGGRDPAGGSDEAARLSDRLEGGSDSAWPEGVDFDSLESRGATARDLLRGTSFAVTAETGRNDHVSLWGRGAVTRFDGREGNLSLDGEVASAMVGADWAHDDWTAGLILSRSVGEGGYAGDSEGRVEATLTGLYPWGRLALSERMDAWGTAGYGTGGLAVTPKRPGTDEDGATIRTDLNLRMAAAGLRGVLVDGDDGLTLTGKTDALIVQTASDAARGPDGGNLAAARATVSRLRLGLEGSQSVSLGGGATLTPSVEIGVRRDGGDAETGFGIDFGGGIAWSDPKRGLSAELRGRALVAHEANGFRERGVSVSLAWDPKPSSARGPALTLTQTVGDPASGGADALLAQGALTGLTAQPGSESDDEDDLRHRRLEARFGYGFPAWGGRFASVPEVGLGLSDTSREYILGWRLAGDGPGALQLSTEARRIERNDSSGAAEHRVGARLSARW